MVEISLTPRPEMIDGNELLIDVEGFLSRFVVYPSEAARIAHVLWIGHAWFMEHWESTPRIAFLSPEPGSGKSRALEVTEPLVPRPVHAVNATPAYLFRKVSDESGPPTVLFDEIDTLFGPKAKDNEEVRGMLNAGHRRGAMAGRCVMRGKTVETEELPAYCAVALAGLDDLPDTIRTRSVIVRMRRRGPSERVEPWRMRLNGPQAKLIAERLAAWSAIGFALDWPEMPDGIEDRNADVWEALLAVADHAGGDWPERARSAAVTLVTESADNRPTLGIQLLADLRTAFGGHESMTTEMVLAALIGMDESPWADLRGRPMDARGLANRLRKYTTGDGDPIKPVVVRIGDTVSRGYRRTDLVDAWSRYLPDARHGPPGSVTSVTTVTPAVDRPRAVTDVTDVTDLHGSNREEPNSSHTSNDPNGSQETPQPCRICGQPLHPAVAAEGFTTCPSCEATR